MTSCLTSWTVAQAVSEESYIFATVYLMLMCAGWIVLEPFQSMFISYLVGDLTRAQVTYIGLYSTGCCLHVPSLS